MVNLHSCYDMISTQLQIASWCAFDYGYQTGIAMNAVHVQMNKILKPSKFFHG